MPPVAASWPRRQPAGVGSRTAVAGRPGEHALGAAPTGTRRCRCCCPLAAPASSAPTFEHGRGAGGDQLVVLEDHGQRALQGSAHSVAEQVALRLHLLLRLVGGGGRAGDKWGAQHAGVVAGFGMHEQAAVCRPLLQLRLRFAATGAGLTTWNASAKFAASCLACGTDVAVGTCAGEGTGCA